MTVKELIESLQKLPPDAIVYTNQCEATYKHEDISPLDTVAYVQDDGSPGSHVYVGTWPIR